MSSSPPPLPIVVLGGRVIVDTGGALTGALGRRVCAAYAAYASDASDASDAMRGVVIASGGCRWAGVPEADAMACALVALGVPDASIVRERLSMSTKDNAHFAAHWLRRHGFSQARVVTCAWHLPRALALFRREGIDALGVPAVEPLVGPIGRAFRLVRERVASRLDGV